MEQEQTKEKEVKAQVINPGEATRDASVDPLDISNEMIQQSGLYLKYALKHQKALTAESNAKMKLEITQSAVDMKIREDAVTSGEKLTEKKIEAMTTTNPRVINAQKEYNDAKAAVVLCKDILEALKQKKDMIIQIGVREREEMKGEARVMEGTTALDELKRRRLERDAK